MTVWIEALLIGLTGLGNWMSSGIITRTQLNSRWLCVRLWG